MKGRSGFAHEKRSREKFLDQTAEHCLVFRLVFDHCFGLSLRDIDLASRLIVRATMAIRLSIMTLLCLHSPQKQDIAALRPGPHRL